MKLFVNFDATGIEVTDNTAQTSGEKEVLDQILSPERIILNYSDENHAVFYSDFGTYFWTNAKSIFSQEVIGDSPKLENMPISDYIELKNQRSITYKFSSPLPLLVFFMSNGEEQPKNFLSNQTSVSEFTISMDSNFFIALKTGETYYKWTPDNYDKRQLEAEFEQMKDREYVKYRNGGIIAASKEVLIPLNLDETQTNVFVSNDMDLNDRVHIEEIVQKFFGSIEKTRKIEENDGTLIYMSNAKGLVFSNDGVVKYFDEIKSPVKTRDLQASLKTYAGFIANKDYLPSNLYLAEIQPIQNGDDKGYRFNFGYKINNKKVILDDAFNKSLEYPVEVEVYNDYIKTYKRYYRKTSSLDRMDSFTFSIDYIMKPLDIMERHIDLFRRNYMKEHLLTEEQMLAVQNTEVLAEMRDINSAYYDYCENKDDAKLVEVWIIALGKTTYIFDAYSGNLLRQFKE